MRLLKTGPYVPGQWKLELIQKWGKDIPKYAILSHTWSSNPDDEVLFADIQNGTSHQKPAFNKMLKAIERAKLDGHGWLWIDTCCIDKTSSVELSEAINSMYSYYKEAEKCYAYLIDVETTEVGEAFHKSRWWRRGWTLQELLAPKTVQFHTSDWKPIGDKNVLRQNIHSITRIDPEYLDGTLAVEHASIAKRMSWAAFRQTTREEDLAYSLIGMFDVNMPMLYGEGGRRAFLRLQEEIMRGNEDQSLFAWIKKDGEGETADGFHGLLADSPKDFEQTGATIPYTELGDLNPTAMTARGLHVTLPLTNKNDGTSIAALQCPVPGQGYSGWLAVYLQRLPTGSHQYARKHCSKLASITEIGYHQPLYVRQHFPSTPAKTVCPYHFFQLRSLTGSQDEYPHLAQYTITNVEYVHTIVTNGRQFHHVAPQPFSKVPLLYQIKKQAGACTTALKFQRLYDGEQFILLLGATTEFEVGFDARDAQFDPAELEGPFARKFFNPRPAGERMRLELHSVRVTVEERVHEDRKIYFVDVDVEPFPKPPTAAEFLQDAVDMFAGQGAQERGASKAALKDKVKRRIWTRETR